MVAALDFVGPASYCKAMARRRKSGGMWGAVRWLARLVVVLVAIPVVLTPVYLFVDPISVPMLQRYVTGQKVIRQWRGIGQVSDRLKASVILSEDGQFCRHWGVDFSALRDEVNDLFAGRPVRGASTITMQVARNLFLWNGESYIRKGLEIPLALYVDLVLPKRRIMEIYLNIAEWGPSGQFGIEAGAQAAFGVEPDALSRSAAALLTTALPNPMLRLPGRPSANQRRIAAVIEDRVGQYGERADCVGENGRLAL
ncbi:MAG: mtgA [Devosia sp.]|nr:mtgA [Devosia sp.]